ncbi:MAG: sirohydrochlorin cobaltochelatase [Planctomycetota bacterium]
MRILILVLGVVLMLPAQQRPVIALVAFGTSVPHAALVYDQIHDAVQARYPEHELRWAYTASFIRRKLAERGRIIPSPAELAAELAAAGHERAVFQSLHVSPGQEYGEMCAIDSHGMHIVFGAPLMATDRDVERLLDALADELQRPEPLVLAGHGNDRYPEHNRFLDLLDSRLRQRRARAWLCTVEGSPGTDGLQAARQAAAEHGAVRFVPAMMVAGDHIMNDVMGEEPDSWRSLVAASASSCGAPLGARPAVHALIIQHLQEALERL